MPESEKETRWVTEMGRVAGGVLGRRSDPRSQDILEADSYVPPRDRLLLKYKQDKNKFMAVSSVHALYGFSLCFNDF